MARPKPVVLMTRPRPSAERFVALLSDACREKIDIIFSPLIEIAPLAVNLENDGAAGVIFTSANAVAAVANVFPGAGRPAYCVGRTTTEAADRAGWTAHFAGHNAGELVENLMRDGGVTPLVHLRGRHTRGDIAGRLTKAGTPVQDRVVYDQILLPLSPEAVAAIKRAETIVAPIFSPRTARHFAGQIQNAGKCHVVALSQAVADPLKTCGFAEIRVAGQPDAASLAETFQSCVETLTRVEGGSAAQ